MSRRDTIATGDTCPLDPAHGPMYVLTTGRQFCAHSAHSAAGQSAVYLEDGTTPLGSPESPSSSSPAAGSPRRRANPRTRASGASPSSTPTPAARPRATATAASESGTESGGFWQF